VKAIFNTSQNRVQAIALVHEKLYQSANLSQIDFAAHVVMLVEGLFRTYGALERGISSSALQPTDGAGEGLGAAT
jgi:hypothetical protein